MFLLILLPLLSTIGLLGLEIDGRLSASDRELVGDPNPFSAILVGLLGGAEGRLSVSAVELGDPNPFTTIGLGSSSLLLSSLSILARVA